MLDRKIVLQDRSMNVYQPRTPRAALGLAATAFAAITMAAMVVVPAELEAAGNAQAGVASGGGATVQPSVARSDLDADGEIAREDDAERAALALPAPCALSPEWGAIADNRS
jgi:hypothetical protein